jgi:hypothetical protein
MHLLLKSEASIRGVVSGTPVRNGPADADWRYMISIMHQLVP